jgi:hypothetical protein
MRNRDDRLAARAYREHWTIPEEWQKGIMAQLVRIATSSPDDRARVGALKALLDCRKINIAAVKATAELELQEGLLERLDKLEEAAGEQDSD